MRILWLNHGMLPSVTSRLGLPDGRGASWIGNMLKEVLEVDSEVRICSLSIGYNSFDTFTEGRVTYVYFGEKGRFYYPKGKIPSSVQGQAKRVISEFKPDVIHVHGSEYFLGCMDEDVYCGVPVVVSLQGILSEYHIHVTGGLSPKEVWWTKFNLRFLKYGATLFRTQTFWRECRAEQEQRVFRQQKYFIGRTEWDRDCVQFYNPKSMYFFGNETLRKVFYVTRRDPERVAKHSIFCGAAAGYPLKGVHWLIRAVAALKSDFPDIQLRIAACAWGVAEKRTLWNRLRDEGYFAYLRKLIRDLGVEKNIVALPGLAADQVADELKNADLFVLPSLCENSPNSLGEAMLVGTPAISTYVGGIPTILRNGEEGVLVQPSDPHALAGAIRRWFEHPELAQRCVEVARKTALERHDPKTNACRTLEIYREIIRHHAHAE